MAIGMWVFAVAGSGPEVQAWLKAYDNDARGGRGYAEFTLDEGQALTWPSFEAAFEAWRAPSTVRPVRPDGKPNRPLTAYTVEFRKIPAESSTT